MCDNFDKYSISIESDVLNQDFDNVDLYGDKLIDEDTNGFGEDIEYE